MCEFDTDGNCYAGACYSKEKCNARDEFGNPKYMSLNSIRLKETEKSIR